jgi:hypothetical protein
MDLFASTGAIAITRIFFAQVCRMETIRWALTTCLQLLKATLLQKINPWRSGIGR